MKNVIKKITFMLIILIILFSFNTKTFAWGEIINAGDNFITTGEEKDTLTKVTPDSIKKSSSYIYNILLSASIVVAAVVATVLGVQFMMGGAEGQAKVKEMLIPFFAGCVVAFGAFTIWKIALTIGNKVDRIDNDESTEGAYIYIIKNNEQIANMNRKKVIL